MGAILKIKYSASENWQDLPDPQTMTYGVYDIDSSSAGRDSTGTMVRDVVGHKRKLECTFPPMGATAMQSLLSKLNGHASFILQFPDASTGAYSTMTCYVGDRSIPVYYLGDPGSNGSVTNWLFQASSINFIEV